MQPEQRTQNTLADVRAVMDTLAATYHGCGAVKLGDPYQVLIATISSQRAREEQTTAVSERVFAKYSDAPALAAAEPGLTREELS